MKQTIPLGRLAGIPIGANWSVIVITALITEELRMAAAGPADIARAVQVGSEPAARRVVQRPDRTNDLQPERTNE